MIRAPDAAAFCYFTDGPVDIPMLINTTGHLYHTDRNAVLFHCFSEVKKKFLCQFQIVMKDLQKIDTLWQVTII